MNKLQEILKQLTNRQIAKILTSIGETGIMSPMLEREIKHHFRQLEHNVSTQLLNITEHKDNQNDKFNR